MPPVWTVPQIESLTDDPGSLRDGKKLATAAKWSGLGVSEEALWGLCQGSAKEPYRTCVDLSDPAFKCSCPSRKFPCKHGIALFLLYAGQPALFGAEDAPEWVASWLQGRRQRAERASPPRAAKAADAADPTAKEKAQEKAQEKRAQARDAKVAAGMGELRLWLLDLARGGLADERVKRYAFWDQMAARMVDAQAGAIARRLRDLAGLPHQGRSDWAEPLLDEIGRLYLLVEAYGRLDTLPPEVQEDVRGLIGWSYKQEELRGRPGVRDRWAVLGQRLEIDNRLKERRVWLQGLGSGRAALLLDFVPVARGFEEHFRNGDVIEAELTFYPSAYPLRALIRQRHAHPHLGQADSRAFVHGTIAAALDAYADALAANPWLDRFPMGLAGVVPLWQGETVALVDGEGRTLPLFFRLKSEIQPWLLVAAGGHRPISIFGEWDGYAFAPLTVYADSIYFPAHLAQAD